jgi:hypothetical protein
MDFVFRGIHTLIDILGQVQMLGKTLVIDVSIASGLLSLTHSGSQFGCGHGLVHHQIFIVSLVFIQVLSNPYFSIGLFLRHLIHVQLLQVPSQVDLLVLDELLVTIGDCYLLAGSIILE